MWSRFHKNGPPKIRIWTLSVVYCKRSTKISVPLTCLIKLYSYAVFCRISLVEYRITSSDSGTVSWRSRVSIGSEIGGVYNQVGSIKIEHLSTTFMMPLKLSCFDGFQWLTLSRDTFLMAVCNTRNFCIKVLHLLLLLTILRFLCKKGIGFVQYRSHCDPFLKIMRYTYRTNNLDPRFSSRITIKNPEVKF